MREFLIFLGRLGTLLSIAGVVAGVEYGEIVTLLFFVFTGACFWTFSDYTLSILVLSGQPDGGKDRNPNA